ncbi:MAG: hypothetical protein PHU85_08750, partial [Phycisphaerae bacterium]|nr:hypothetical protein [Phycisphaerae bacterium]
MRHFITWSILLALLVPRLASAQPAPNEGYGPWVDAKLKEMADAKLAIEKRVAARDALIASASDSTLDPTKKMERCRELGDKNRLPAYIASTDPFTSIGACMIAAKPRHVYLARDVLKDCLTSNQPMVRYWGAKGLADVQMPMYAFGDKEFYEQPVADLLKGGLKEDNLPVLQNIYAALGASDPAKMDNARKNMVKYQAFMELFKQGVGKLNKWDLTNAAALVAALNSANEWSAVFSPIQADLLRWEGQALRWASQLYDQAQSRLTDEQKGVLEHIMLKAAANLAGQTGKKDILTKLQADIKSGDRDMLQLNIINVVGAPGVGDYQLKALKVPPAADLAPDLN